MANQAMIAFLPSATSWCKQDFPHMTLAYAGSTEGRSESDFNAMAKDAISVARITGSFSLQVTGVEEFGPPDDLVDVLTFHPTPQLLVARMLVEKWDTGEFPIFKPHATIGPAGSALDVQMRYGNNYGDEAYTKARVNGLPLYVRFNQIATCWNDNKLIFDLSEIY